MSRVMPRRNRDIVAIQRELRLGDTVAERMVAADGLEERLADTLDALAGLYYADGRLASLGDRSRPVETALTGQGLEHVGL